NYPSVVAISAQPEYVVSNSSNRSRDSNVVSSDVGHRVYDGNSTVSPKKQCLDSPSRISSPPINVSFYGVRNITNISDDVVPNTYIGQPIAMLDRCDALPDTEQHAKFFQETHVPNFKVRLYNVVGVKEYELPTGDMLGAIVYEHGPESEMDYDMVLEARSGHP
nr:helitron helicase-like domain-containing protein [Tanacetum cinerariifolium]